VKEVFCVLWNVRADKNKEKRIERTKLWVL